MSAVSEKKTPSVIEFLISPLNLILSLAFLAIGLALIIKTKPSLALDIHPKTWEGMLGKNILLPYGNLLLLLHFLVKKIWPVIDNHLNEREKNIASSISDFGEKEGEVAARFAEIKEKLANVETEVVRIKDRAENIAKTEAEKVVNKATQRAARMEQDAQMLAEHEAFKVRQEVQGLIIEQSFGKARNKLSSGLSQEQKENLESTFLQQVGGA